MDPSPLAPGSSGSDSGSGPAAGGLPPLPDWLLWVQAGITALVAVLFVALLVQTRQQGTKIQELQERLQGLENSRALERTTGLEDQLRAAVERLQTLERNDSRVDVLQAEIEALSEQLSRQPPAPPPTPPATPPSSGEGNPAGAEPAAAAGAPRPASPGAAGPP